MAKCKEDHEDIYKHIETTNHELGQVQADIMYIKAEIGWLKKISWAILVGILAIGLKALAM